MIFEKEVKGIKHIASALHEYASKPELEHIFFSMTGLVKTSLWEEPSCYVLDQFEKYFT